MAGVKGRSGRQPNERYVSKAINDALKANDYARLQRLINMLLDKACAGDLTAAGMLFDRAEGKPVAAVEVDMQVTDLDEATLNERIAHLQEKLGVR